MPRRVQTWSDKRLPTPIKAPTNTAIGKPLQSLLPAGAVKLARTEHPSVGGDQVAATTDTFDLDGDGRADARLVTWRTLEATPQVDRSMLQLTPRGSDARPTWFASKTGLVDAFYVGNGVNGTWTRDNDGDGRVDEVSMKGTDMGHFTLDGHSGTPLDWKTFEPVQLEPGRLPSQVVSRSLKDTDGDGAFDQETVGGLWWRKDD